MSSLAELVKEFCYQYDVEIESDEEEFFDLLEEIEQIESLELYYSRDGMLITINGRQFLLSMENEWENEAGLSYAEGQNTLEEIIAGNLQFMSNLRELSLTSKFASESNYGCYLVPPPNLLRLTIETWSYYSNLPLSFLMPVKDLIVNYELNLNHTEFVKQMERINLHFEYLKVAGVYFTLTDAEIFFQNVTVENFDFDALDDAVLYDDDGHYLDDDQMYFLILKEFSPEEREFIYSSSEDEVGKNILKVLYERVQSDRILVKSARKY